MFLTVQTNAFLVSVQKHSVTDRLLSHMADGRLLHSVQLLPVDQPELASSYKLGRY